MCYLVVGLTVFYNTFYYGPNNLFNHKQPKIFAVESYYQDEVESQVSTPTSIVVKDESQILKPQKDEKELLSSRTETFNTFLKPDGKIRIAGQETPINYKNDPSDATEPYKQIDLSIEATPDRPWQYAMDNNSYQARFWSSRQIKGEDAKYVAQYRSGGQWLEMAPIELTWQNDQGEKQLISLPLAVAEPEIDNDNYTITWKNAFGNGIDFRYNLSTKKFFKTLIINSTSSLPAATIDPAGLKLTVAMALSWSENALPQQEEIRDIKTTMLGSNIDAALIDKQIDNPDEFSFKNSLGVDLWRMQNPVAWDTAPLSSSDGEARSGDPLIVDSRLRGNDNTGRPNYFDLSQKIQQTANQIYTSISLDNAKIADPNTNYPIFIDVAIADLQSTASTHDASNFGTAHPGDGNFSINSVSNNSGASTSNFYISANRFLPPIPKNATVDSAYVSFNAATARTDDIDLTFYAEDVDSAAVFAADTHEPYDSYLARTTNSAQWTFNTDTVAGSWYNSSDLSSPVTEIVTRASWASANGMVLLNINSGTSLPGTDAYQSFQTYDAGAAYAPKFNAIYTITPTGTTRTWDGGGANANWSTAGNWSGDTVPVSGDAIVFDGTSTKSATVNSTFIAQPYSISVNSGYSGTITQAVHLVISGSSGNFTLNSGTWAMATYNLDASGSTVAIGTTLTIGASASTGLRSNDLTISAGGAITCTAACKINILGSYVNSGTFTASTGRVTFAATTSGKTVSGALNDTSSFYKVTFSGIGGSWTIQDSMKVSAANGADNFIIGNGTVTFGDSNGDTLEVDGKMTIANTASQVGTFQTTALPEGSVITVQMNKDSSTSCLNCLIVVGATSGSGQGNLKVRKNTTLKLIPNAAASDAGIQTETTGYLEIQGSKDYTGTSNSTTSEITITDTTKSWSANENNGKVVRITSGLAFGKIYDITGTSATTLTRADNSTDTETSPIVSGEGPTRTLTLTTKDSIITADNDHVGRYIHNLDTDTYYQIVDSTEVGASQDTLTIIAEPQEDFTGMSTNNDIEITDGVKTGDTYEILDYASVTAENGTACDSQMGDSYESYIYSKAGSENVIRYADICNMGRSASTKYGLSFNAINGANANEGMIVDKSRIRNGYYGVYSGSSNGSYSSNSIYANAINGISIGYSEGNSNNIFTYNNIYSNHYSGINDMGYNNTYDHNNIYKNYNGIYSQSFNTIITSNSIYANIGVGIKSELPYCKISSNEVYANDSHGIASGGSNTIYTFNNIYANQGVGIYSYNESSWNTIFSNNIYTNLEEGIYSNGYNNTIGSNNIYENLSFGINLDGSEDTTLLSNIADNNMVGLRDGGINTLVLEDGYGTHKANTTADIERLPANSPSHFYNTRYNTFSFKNAGYSLMGGKSSSQVVGIAYNSTSNDSLAIFYDDGTFSYSAANFYLDHGYVSTPYIYHYSLPEGKNTSQIIGVTQESKNTSRLAIFYDDGTYSSSNSTWQGNADVAAPNLHNYTLAEGYSYSQVVGIEEDHRNEGKLSVFYNDGKYSVADDGDWDGTTDVSVPLLRSYTLPSAKSTAEILEISGDAWLKNKMGVWYSDGSYSVSPEIWDADEDIAATTLYDSAFPSAAISYQDNGTAGLTKIFGHYVVPDQNVETPQDEASLKINYTKASWPKSATPHGHSNYVSDSNLDYDLTSASLSAGPYSYRATVNILGPDGKCTSAIKPTFDIYRNGVDIGLDATCGTQFTDTTDGVNVKFKIDGGELGGYDLGDSYTFTVWDASNDANVQKTVQFQQDRDSLTAGSGKTVEFNGVAGHPTTLSSLVGNWILNLADTSTTIASHVNVSHSNNTGSPFCASYSSHDTPNTNTNWQISPTGVCAAPTASTGFNGSPNSSSQITWNWLDNADDEENYRVKDASNTTLSGDLAAGTTSWVETGLDANTQYGRHANAVNTTGNTDSNISSVYTLANNPSGLRVTSVSSSQIKLEWDSVGAQSKFNIYRDGIAGVGTLVYSANDLSFTDSLLSPKTSYTYYFYTVNGDGVVSASYLTATMKTRDVSSSSAAPVADFIATQKPDEEKATSSPAQSKLSSDKPISFDASTSVDDVEVASVLWDLGDGTTSTEVKVDHLYNSPGRYTVTLTVTDKSGYSSIKIQTIDVNPPRPEIKEIKASGKDLLIQGKAYPKSIVSLTIHSDPITADTKVDENGDWSYQVANAQETLGTGDHTATAINSFALADATLLTSDSSKTYDFKVSLDDGKLRVEMIKRRIWQSTSVTLTLVLIVVIYLFFDKKYKITTKFSKKKK